MTRSDVIQQLSRRFPQLTIADVNISVVTILDAISQRLSEGGRAEIRGFGAFSVNIRPSRVGRNPRTGEKVKVPEKQAPHFKAGKELKERVNSKRNAPRA
jgi:integration host factor subunit beta